jgi:hypothetical protein
LTSLKQAIEQGRVEEFIRQEEARGIGPASRRELEAKIARAIK